VGELTDAAKKLQQACDQAYDKNLGSCSHAVWAVLKEITNKDEPYRVANDLVDHMKNHWESVTVQKGHDLANTGVVVVGGTKKEKGSGHVVVIYPGDVIANGGYMFFWKKGNKNLMMRATGHYPRALSTSSGNWPGARSRGDKTIWDPWGSDEAFKQVKFFTVKTE